MVESQDFDVAPKQRAFLAAYRLTVTITRAAGVAQMHRSTVNLRGSKNTCGSRTSTTGRPPEGRLRGGL